MSGRLIDGGRVEGDLSAALIDYNLGYYQSLTLRQGYSWSMREGLDLVTDWGLLVLNFETETLDNFRGYDGLSPCFYKKS